MDTEEQGHVSASVPEMAQLFSRVLWAGTLLSTPSGYVPPPPAEGCRSRKGVHGSQEGVMNEDAPMAYSHETKDWSKATDEELADRALAVVTEVAAFMGITPQWHLTIMVDDLVREGEANSAGRVEWPVLYHKANIKFDRQHLRDAPDEVLVEVVVHEMVHILCAPSDDMLKEQIGRNSFTYMRWCDMQEGVCDSIAFVIIKAMGSGYDPVRSLEKKQ